MLSASGRIDSIDFVKGICIFLVVWAHSIQNMGADNAFWENPLHIVICSFHMPIFMLLSGLFFSKVINKEMGYVIKRKFIQLIIPCFGWSAILVLIHSCIAIYNADQVSVFTSIKQLFYETGTRFWFLRSVFICYVLAFVSIKIFKRDYIACIASILLFLLMSDNFRLALDKFMYPYFWAGYFLYKYGGWIDRHKKTIMVVTFTLFALLLFFWRREDYIYVTGMSFYAIENGQVLFYPFCERVGIVFYRYLIGMTGSLFFFVILQQAYNSNFYLCNIIKNVGKYTLGIYVIHIIIEGLILERFDLSGLGFMTFNFIITPLISIVLIAFCLLIIKVLERNKFSGFLFLGIYNTSQRKQRL